MHGGGGLMAVKTPFIQCFESAANAAGWDIRNQKDAEAKLADAMRAVSGRMQRYVDQEGMTPRDAAIRAGRELGEQTRAAAAIQRRNDLLNLQKRTALRMRVAARASELKKDKLFRALHSEISALNTPTSVGGNRFSTEAKMSAEVRGVSAAVVHDLEKEKLLDVAASGRLDDDTAREIYELSMQDSGRPAQVGKTGDQQALAIAKIMRKYLNLARAKLNREGAWIGDYAGYILRTTHDPDLIYKAGAEQWAADVSQWIDAARTFEGVDDPAKFLAGAWAALSDGVHLDDSGGVGMKDPAFAGPGNAAKRLSQGRVLHWKDADSWLAYQKKYATGTLMDRFARTIDRSARQYALLADWGTNPRAEFENTMRWLIEDAHKAGRLDEVRDFGPASQKALSDLFGDLDGSNNKPMTSLMAKIGANVRNVVAMSKLGAVLLTHMNALGTGASELAFHGIPYLESYRNHLASVVAPLANSPERERVISLIGAGIENLHGAAMGTGWVDDSLPGTMSKIRNNFFRLTGLTYMVHALKDGVSLMVAHDLALDKGKAFAELAPARQAILRQYGFTERDWDILRNAPDHPTANGREYLTPDAAMRSTEDLSDRERDALGLKLRAYLTDTADRYIVTPNIADKRISRGTITADPNSALGQAARFLSQFKAWPVAAARQGFGREINGRVGLAGKVTGIMHLIAATTALGYLRMVLNDYSKGLTPPKPDGKAFLAAMVQGGGLGIFGDYLFGQSNRFGQSFAETAAGPVLGSLADTMMKTWNDAKAGNGKAVTTDLSKAVLDNTPFINLFYLRGALNYLFIHSMQETLNPGYLERHARKMQQDTGQSYLSPGTPVLGLFTPQRHLRPFGR